MTSFPLPTPLAERLARHGFSAESGDALLIVARGSATVLWASGSALAQLSAIDLSEIEEKLFRTHARGRAAAARLSRLSAGGAFRLERLFWPDLPVPLVVACHAIDDADEPIILLHIRSARVPGAARPCAPTCTVESAKVEAVPTRPDPPVTRILWETDGTGRLTYLGPEARLLETGLPTLGEDLPAWLRGLDAELADRIALAATQQGSVSRVRLLWPREAGREPLAVDVGCAAKRGGEPGLRGFFTVHGGAEALPDGPPAPTEADVADGAPTQAESKAEPQDEVAAPAPRFADDAEASQDPAPAEREPTATEPMPQGNGNVVHFPIMRLGPVPANFVPALRPAPPSEPSPEVAGLPDLQWSEAPPAPSLRDETFDNLSADERDAFEHIRKVLGTRPFATPDRKEAQAAAQGLPPGLFQLLDHVPVGLKLETQGAAYANAALRDRLGAEAAAASSLRQDGVASMAEVATFDLAGAPATLTILPSEPPAKDAPAAHVPADSLDLVTDGYLRLDEGGAVLELSPKAARLLGLEPAAARGRSFASMLYEGQAAGWQALAAAATGPEAQPQGPSPLRLRNAAGQPVAAQVRLGRSNGALLCALTLDRPAATPANDTAEAARIEAERTSALKSEFLAKVSHEIRTPLNAILGFAEVIRDERLGPVGNARYLEYLRDIHASGTHVMSLVNDLLDLSRIEAGRMDLNLEAVDANAIVQSCVNTLQTQAHRERIVVRLSLTARLPATLVDERSLRQIVLNLLSNAIKFNEPGGQVIVSTALAGSDGVAIRIRDTGIGMSEDEIETAMEPFRQLSTVNRTGSGLGLPLTKALVEANCASMTIKSTRGEGTLVEVTFPVVEPDSMSLPAE